LPEPIRVLVLVKATPQPSKQYGDTVCVAGIDLGADPPRWVRLYPVPFRYLDGDNQFKKYDVIRVLARSAGADKRPESRKIDASAVEVECQIGSWAERDAWLSGLENPTMCDLQRQVRADINAQSLAAVRPASVQGLDFDTHPGWTLEELARFEQYQNQGDLFRETAPRLLEPPAFNVRLKYRCTSEGCDGHSQRIIDWELAALQRRYRWDHHELKRAVTRNFFDVPFGRDRAPLIYVGNQENVQRRAAFTILGLYYPKKGDLRQKERLF
jgi:hypothetical protein